jgi:hypothetical protein
MAVIDVDRIMNRANRAWGVVIDKVDPAMTNAIQRRIYIWDRPTRRRNGETVTSPRDIVDTEELLNSQGLRRVSVEKVIIFNTAPHAMKNHEGTGNRRPRRWTRKAIRGNSKASPSWQDPQATLNIAEAFADAFRAG